MTSANITCFQFKKEGHEIKDCRKDIESKSNKDWIRTKPVDSVSQTISKYNMIWYWCTKYNRQNTIHSTDKYVKGVAVSVPLADSTVLVGTTVPTIVDSDVDDNSAPLHVNFSHMILEGIQIF